MQKRIHIVGASCTGTTTLGRALADHLSIPHLDTDNYYWKDTPLRYSEKMPIPERIASIEHDISGHSNWILSGSLCSWGEPLITHFTHVIFLHTTWEVRKARLLTREELRYGKDILTQKSEQGEISRAFLQWASRYDTAGPEQRSLVAHQQWISALPQNISIFRFDANQPIKQLSEAVLAKFD
tara:strand:+ start:8266 stop:8814 length:549 start_codon:yes stop_codon:yes gene_type:complete